MTKSKRMAILATALLLVIIPAWAQQKHAIAFENLMALSRVGEPAISPDGRWVAYTVTKPELAANRATRNIWMVSTAGDSEPRQLTQSRSDWRPRWPPGGKRLAV